jgi:hypothetical protein
MPDAFFVALEKTQETYRKYRVARDFAEFDATGRDPAWAVDGKSFAIMCLIRHRELAPDKALAEYNRYVEVYGAPAVKEIAERLRRTPRRGGAIQDLASLRLVRSRTSLVENMAEKAALTELVPQGFNVVSSSSPMAALTALLNAVDPRGFLIGELRNRQRGQDWDEAFRRYRQWEAAFGKESVLRMARSVIGSPGRYDAIVKVPGAGQEVFRVPFGAFVALAQQNPKGYVRIAIAYKLNTYSPTAIQAEYDRLASRRGEAALLDTATLFAKVGFMRPSQLSAEQRRLQSAPLETGGAYDLLLSVLTETKTPALDVVAAQVTNPRYTAWAAFQPGAAVTLLTTTGTRQARGPAVQPVGEELWVLKSVTQDAVQLEYTRSRGGRPLQNDVRSFVSGGHREQFSRPWINDANFPGRGEVQEKSGMEDLSLNGRTYRTRWMQRIDRAGPLSQTTTAWVSDDIPGGLVKILTETTNSTGATTSTETVLKEALGTRTPGAKSALAALEKVYPAGSGTAPVPAAAQIELAQNRPALPTKGTRGAIMTIEQLRAASAPRAPSESTQQPPQAAVASPSAKPSPGRSPSPAPSIGRPAAEPPRDIAGCWTYNGVPVRIEADGRVTGFVQPGRAAWFGVRIRCQ